MPSVKSPWQQGKLYTSIQKLVSFLLSLFLLTPNSMFLRIEPTHRQFSSLTFDNTTPYPPQSSILVTHMLPLADVKSQINQKSAGVEKKIWGAPVKNFFYGAGVRRKLFEEPEPVRLNISVQSNPIIQAEFLINSLKCFPGPHKTPKHRCPYPY